MLPRRDAVALLILAVCIMAAGAIQLEAQQKRADTINQEVMRHAQI